MPLPEQQPMRQKIGECVVFHAWLIRAGQVHPGTARRLWYKATVQFDVHTVVTQFLTTAEFEKWQVFRTAATEYFGERFVPDLRVQEQGMERKQLEETIRGSRRYWYVE